MKLSKIGLSLSILYIIFTAIVFGYAFSCSSEMYCGLVAIVPILPWNFILEALFPSGVGGFLDSSFGLFTFAVVNTVIIYYIGLLINRLVEKVRGETLPL